MIFWSRTNLRITLYDWIKILLCASVNTFHVSYSRDDRMWEVVAWGPLSGDEIDEFLKFCGRSDGNKLVGVCWVMNSASAETRILELWKRGAFGQRQFCLLVWLFLCPVPCRKPLNPAVIWVLLESPRPGPTQSTTILQ